MNYGWWYAGFGQDGTGTADMMLPVQAVNISGGGCPPGPYNFQAGRIGNQCDAFHFWSPHFSAGAHFLLADSAVRFVPYSADPILPALASRSGGEAADLP